MKTESFELKIENRNGKRTSLPLDTYIKTIEYFSCSLEKHDTIDKVLVDIAQNLVSLLNLPDIVIYLLDKNSNLLIQKVAFGEKNNFGGFAKNPLAIPFGTGIVGSVAKSGNPEIIPDTDKDSRYIEDQGKRYSEIAVPILVDNEVIGVIDSEHIQHDYFNRDHLRLLTSISKLCANRISKLKTDEQLRFSELKIKRNEELLTSTQKLMKIGSWEWDLKTDNVIWSDNLYEIFEIDPLIYPLTPLHYLNRIHKDDFERVYETVQNCIRNGKPYELEHRAVFKEHREKIIRAVGEAIYDSSSGITRLIGTAQDVTDKNKTESERLYNEALLRSMFDESPDALFLTTIMPKNILHVNKRAAELFEMENEAEFIGKFGPHFHKIPWGQQDFDLLGKSLDEKNYWTSEIEYVTQKGNLFWGSITIKRLRIQSEWYELVRVVDITKSKSLEFQLIQAQKMESIGTIAGGIAHDFNNLLSMIMGASELIKLQAASDQKITIFADRILEAGEKGAEISKQLLLFAKPELTELKPISLSHLLIQVQQMVSHFLPKNISITTELNLKNGIIKGDNGHIYQVLLNLTLNAADAMPNGGKISFKQNNVPLEKLVNRFPEAVHTEYVSLSISDTGTGMPKEIMDRIFDPFFTTKEKGKGTGLGLSIVHGIMKSHKGFIDVKSELGSGTTFTIYLPVVPANQTEKEETSLQENKILPVTEKERLTILIVDDEKMIRESLIEYVKMLGHHVLISDDGINGLYLFKRKKHSIDLIITDLGMPRMGGEEFIEKVFEIKPSARIIVTSGYLDKSPKNDLLKKGVLDVVTKPYKLSELKRQIDGVVRLKKLC